MIEFYPIKNSEDTVIAATILLDSQESLEHFKTLVFRATNLWPDAPPEIKEFADMLEHGKVLQDYRGQDTSKR